MTAPALARCDCCGTAVPVQDTYAPGGAVRRCRDTAACERRAIRRYDPTLVPDEDRPVPPPAGAPAGAACPVCHAGAPAGGLYERMPGQWACRDRAGCQQRSVESLYLTAWSDESPDRLISAAEMRAMAPRPEMAATRPAAEVETAQEHAVADAAYSRAAAARRG